MFFLSGDVEGDVPFNAVAVIPPTPGGSPCQWINFQSLRNVPNGIVSSPMCDVAWDAEFRTVHDRAVNAWKAGRRSPESMVTASDAAFLSDIGCSPQELFDFVDDYLTCGEPDFDTVLAIQSLRRDHFLGATGGAAASRVASMESLPSKSATLGGIAWLPRIIAKARLKLRGELPADLMFGCGGDRDFLRSVRMSLPQFLQLVRDFDPDETAILQAVLETREAASR